MQILRMLKSLLGNNLIYKSIALILGISFWIVWGESVSTQRSVNVPLTFYNIDRSRLSAPETIRLSLSGKRIDLNNLDSNQLALHIDGENFVPGENLINIQHQQLLLPNSMRMVYYEPSNLVIHVR